MQWKKTYNFVESHNNGDLPFEVSLNEFSDLSEEEFSRRFLTLKTKKYRKRNTGIKTDFIPFELPDSIDYRKEGYVSPVRRQRACGSCYAFTSAGSIEGAIFKANGVANQLSAQQIIDCSSDFQNEGCKGGDMFNSFNYTLHSDGLMDESCYPYKDQLLKCPSPKVMKECSHLTKIKDYRTINEGSEYDLAVALVEHGPVGVGVMSGGYKFRSYSSGIYEDQGCVPDNINHAMLLVGYGFDEKTQKKYWILKNSWGETWGVKGYMYALKDNNNTLCISSYAAVAIV